MENRIKTGPTVEPVSAAELGAHLRLHSDSIAAETSYLESLIKSAREAVELETRRALNTQTWELAFDEIPVRRQDDEWWDGVREGARTQERTRGIEIPISPLLDVTAITYYSDEDVESTMSSSEYHVDTRAVPGRVLLRTGAVWPTFTRAYAGLIIEYTAGYGPNATDVPSALRQAVMITAADWYENRESVVIGTITSTVQNSIGAILEKYKVHKL